MNNFNYVLKLSTYNDRREFSRILENNPSELIALKSGTTSIDRDIFQVKLNIPRSMNEKQKLNEKLLMIY